jgi:hypothetical protein
MECHAAEYAAQASTILMDQNLDTKYRIIAYEEILPCSLVLNNRKLDEIEGTKEINLDKPMLF